MATKIPQIGADLTSDEHRDFCAYADRLLLKDSALANLLIARELRLKRLPTLRDRYIRNVPKEPRCRVTAHQTSARANSAFRTHAEACDLGLGAAAAIIFRAELDEAWLWHCMDLIPENQFDSHSEIE